MKTLGPGRANVAFQYTALTYLAPGRMNFRYLLEGYDRDWTNAGSRREAFYTNLPPGKFRFRVVACGAFVNCNESGVAFDFEVAPQFYQRAWFIPLCMAVAALLAWLAYRFRVQQLREQFVLVLAERSRIARELHDTLIQGFSGITMQMHAFTNRLAAKEDQQNFGGEGEIRSRPRANGVARIEGLLAARGPVDVRSWEPAYGRLAEAQVRWESAHGRPLPRG